MLRHGAIALFKRLQIRGFQRHKKLNIEFSPTITTIVGATDTGKSSIYRALKYLATNRPKGDSFINWDVDTTALCLDVDESRLIRKKGKENFYKVGKHKLTAFGTDVPEEVQKLLNISEINFQNQHDSPFWLTETAGEVSRQLNAVVDLSSMDKMLSAVASRLRSLNAENKTILSRIKDAEEEQQQLEKADGLIKAFDHIEKLQQQYDSTLKKHSRLVILTASLRKKLKLFRTMSELTTQAVIIDDTKQKIMQAERQCTGLKRVTDSLKKHQAVLNNPVPDNTDIEETITKYKTACDEIAQLELAIESIEDFETEIYEWQTKRKTLSASLKKLTKNKCPICQRPM